MGLSKLSIPLICFLTLTLTLALFQPSHAQNTQQDYLNAHNAARALVGVSDITWDTALANYAQTYANQRIGDCNTTPLNDENIAKGPNAAFTGISAVNIWVGEESFYNYTLNTCATGKVCSHYTQVVWSNSVKLGCSRVQCVSPYYA